MGPGRADLQHPAHRIQPGTAQTFVRRGIFGPGAHVPSRHRTPLGLHPQHELYVQPRELPFQRPDLVLRAGLPAGIRASQFGESRRDLSDLARGLQIPLGLLAAQLPFDAPHSPRIHLGGHSVEQLHAVSLDYQLPVWCPEGGIGSVVYIKRIRLNAGGDYAQFRDAGHDVWRRIWSVGGDLVVDFNAFRQPASATSTFKLSCYKPSKGSMWFAASVGLPF